MNTSLKPAAFGLGLVAVFGAAVGAGSAVGPVGPAVRSSPDDHTMDEGAMDEVEGGAAFPGPHVRFPTTVPSAGTYRLFLDVKHGDVVRTAAFTVTATATHEESGS
jgi:hypothetical protein